MRPSSLGLLVFYMVAAIAAELPAQGPTPESIARSGSIKCSSSHCSRHLSYSQAGRPVVESWVAEQLKQLGDFEYFAVTNWVPVCDGCCQTKP